MTKIALIACSKTKKTYPAKARDLYISPLFRYSLLFAEQVGSQLIYILSAKHGVIHSDSFLAPYDFTLQDMSLTQKKEWSSLVNKQLNALISPSDQLLLLAGNKYTESLALNTAMIYDPLKGLQIINRMAYMKRFLNSRNVYLSS